MDIVFGALKMAALVALVWVCGENRRAVSSRQIVVGLALQLGLALLLLKAPMLENAMLGLNALVTALQNATNAGTGFVFGYLGGADLPFSEPWPGAAFVLAFKALPLILVISALSSLLYYWRIIPLLVRGFSFCLERTMNVGGALGISVSANIFVGMIEAPLFIRPYLARMTRSELFTLMTSGMATIAGTMLVLYASILEPVVPGALGHILVASIISAPAAIMVSRLMIPETGEITVGRVQPPQAALSSMDAVVKGTVEGVKLLLNVTAMLVVFVALVALANMILETLPLPGGDPLTLQRMLGWIMSPLVWLAGVPWSEAQTAGSLMGTKIVLNELVAYLDMARLPADALSPRSRMIMTYAMCGFANLGSLGIMVGGIGAMVPERRDEIVALGPRSIVAGVFATLLTGAVIGILY
ncbi:NupC/NupG family nucleoside CNT transporter [Paucidesulfovibrio longus]|uniref:NupC/NupG family nucleoside CNT transporter n=1 Tax=Paucidesulfovibrio longus TaxID=889 RepID=UPI0003B759A1|nr:nucleoside transporter C-terminal domain-containing protein [Paucidesulfovibrio longus]